MCQQGTCCYNAMVLCVGAAQLYAYTPSAWRWKRCASVETTTDSAVVDAVTERSLRNLIRREASTAVAGATAVLVQILIRTHRALVSFLSSALGEEFSTK